MSRVLVNRLLQVIDRGLGGSSTIPAGGDLVKETDNRLLQHLPAHVMVQTCRNARRTSSFSDKGDYI